MVNAFVNYADLVNHFVNCADIFFLLFFFLGGGGGRGVQIVETEGGSHCHFMYYAGCGETMVSQHLRLPGFVSSTPQQRALRS